MACGTAAQWAALARGPQLAEVTEADLAAARERFGRLFLMHLVAVIFDLPTRSAARAAVRRGAVRLNGRVVRRGDAPAAAPGDSLSLEAGVAEVPDDLETLGVLSNVPRLRERLRKWNARSSRQEAVGFFYAVTRAPHASNDGETRWKAMGNAVSEPARAHFRPRSGCSTRIPPLDGPW